MFSLLASFLLFKLYKEPVSLVWVKNYITNKLHDNHINVQISDISLILDKAQKILTLKITDMNISDLDNKKFIVNMPTIQLDFGTKSDIAWFFRKVNVISPRLYVDITKANIYSLFKKQNYNASSYNILLFKFFTELLVQNGKIEFANENRIMSVNASFLNQSLDNIFKMLAEIHIDNAVLKSNISIHDNDTTEYNLQGANIPLSLITKIMNGYDNFNDTQILLKSLNIQSTISPSKAIDIENADLQFSNGGSVHIRKDMNSKKNSELKITIANFPIEYLKHLWPDWIGSQAKQWTVSHLFSGTIMRGTLWIDLCSFQKKCAKNIIPKGQYKPKMPLGMLRIENVDLTYLEGYTPIEKIYGTISLDEQGVLVNGMSGIIGQSSLSKTLVRIPYAIENTNNITIKGQVEGPIIDLISFIPEDNIDKAAKDNINLKEVKGSAFTDVNIKIPMQDDISFQDIIFNINSKLTDISLEKLPNNAYLDNGQLTVIFNGKKAELLGQAKLDKNPIEINWVGYIEPNSEYDTILKVKTEIHAENAQNFTIFDEEVIKAGKIIVNTNITAKNNKSNLDIEIDLKNAEFTVAAIGFKKDLGDPVTGVINAYIENENTITVKKFLIKGKNILINGQGEIDKALLLPNKLYFDQIRFLNNDFMAEYTNSNHVVVLNIKGRSLDLNQIDFDKIAQDKNRGEFNAMNTRIKLDQVYMKNDVLFHNVDASLECNMDNCKAGYFFAKMGKDSYNYLKIRLTPKSFAESILTLEADNASLVLNAFNIYQNIKNGILLAYHTKHYDKQNTNSIFKGKILMQDFIAIKTPVLAKLLTFSSLPGIVRLLGDNHIPFKELTSDLQFKENVLRIYNGNVIGSELGLTMEGYVDLANKKINVEGTIVPEFYSLNRTLASLPLIGQIITGSKKSKGVFAANYSITGNLSNVKTSLNPISLFTPGFLRGIFNVFKHNKLHPQP